MNTGSNDYIHSTWNRTLHGKYNEKSNLNVRTDRKVLKIPHIICIFD